jgi:hypothetical protein
MPVLRRRGYEAKLVGSAVDLLPSPIDEDAVLVQAGSAFPSDPRLTELVELAAQIARLTGARAQALPPDHEAAYGDTGGSGDLWQIVNIWLPHIGDQLLGALTTLVVAWARSKYKPNRPILGRILGPDGRVVKVVRKDRAKGEADVLPGDVDDPGYSKRRPTG